MGSFSARSVWPDLMQLLCAFALLVVYLFVGESYVFVLNSCAGVVYMYIQCISCLMYTFQVCASHCVLNFWCTALLHCRK